MVIESEDWKAKDGVFDAVCEKIDKIITFRNDEYAQIREMVRKKLEAEKIKVDNAEIASQEVAIEAADAIAKQSQDGSAEKLEAEEAAQVASSQHLHPEDDAKSSVKDHDPAIRTVDSKKLMSENGITSHGGTSRSFAKSSKMMARVSEITESQKQQKWEEMLSLYYGEGIQQFNMMTFACRRF